MRIVGGIDEALQVRPIVVGDFPGEPFLKRQGGLVADLAEKLVGGLSLGRTEEGGCYRKVSHQDKP
jgi:hypothetical protein